ncbi:hypothetical protein HPB48_013514 [Haemaphysalis longicornis]|uniref:Uncharacterized protein n=1 Tax=Haemaphysalis longicornis TaxID=44386 RepID=A0A9J6GVN4_HAELO|nr:hypothetical protein HPB48_013514 [Haemaphysalis longicornis]
MIPTISLRQTLKYTKITFWATFRKHRDQGDTTWISSLERWTGDQHQDVNKYSKEIALTTEAPAVDSHLSHLWEARKGLQRR